MSNPEAPTPSGGSSPASPAPKQNEEFVIVEYKESLALIKHYDQRQAELVKFVSALSAGVPSALFAFAKLGGAPLDYFWPFTAFVATFTAISIFSVFAALVQVRAYFIYAARQANSIRDTMTTARLFENYLWTNRVWPAFNWRSAHTVIFIFVCIQGGLFAGVASFAAAYSRSTIWCAGVAATITALIIATTSFVIAARYLSNLPDKA